MTENRVRHVCLRVRAAESYGKERIRIEEELCPLTFVFSNQEGFRCGKFSCCKLPMEAQHHVSL